MVSSSSKKDKRSSRSSLELNESQTQSQSNSPKKVYKPLKNKHKYASKFVAEVLDNQIESSLEETKYPLATGAWMKKLKASLLQKISQSSQQLFLDEDPATLDNKIAHIKKQIITQQEQLRDTAKTMLSRSKLSSLPQLPDPNPEIGRFDPQIKESIIVKIRRIADDMHTSATLFNERASNFNETVSAVEKEIDLVLDVHRSAQISKQTNQTSITSASKPSNRGRPRKNDKETPMNKLLDQLHKK